MRLSARCYRGSWKARSSYFSAHLSPFHRGFHSSSNNTTNHVPFLRTRCAKNLRLTVRDFPLTICYLLFAIDPPLIIFPPRSDGRVAEWSNVPDSKSGVPVRHRGFESHPFRVSG